MTKPTGLATRRPVTPELVRDALGHIPPDVDRETWVRVAMALKASDLPEGAAFELFDTWSASGEHYSATDARDTWRSVKAGGKVTVGTLFGIAKDRGFRFPAAADVQAPAPDAAEAQRLAEAKRQQRETEAARYRERADQAAREARRLWDDAADAPARPGYLQRKGVGAHGVRFLPDGTLLVPLRDEAGELQNLQRIAPEKPAGDAPEKRFLPGGRKTGLWHLVGDVEGATVLLLAEGYATAASVHEATGRPVAVCFDAGNLVAVAKLLPGAFPGLPLLVCGDDDQATAARSGKNPGREKAASAVRAAQALQVPAAAVFPDGVAEDGSDFNDLATQAGADAVRHLVEAAALALLAEAASAPAPADAEATDAEAPAKPEGGPRLRVVPGGKGKGAAASSDGAGGRAAGRSGGGPRGPAGGGSDGGGDGDGGGDATPSSDPFHLDDHGVWHTARDAEGNPKRPTWVCAPLQVTARTRADDANGWGYLLEFTDPDDNAKLWAMPASMLSGEGAEWAGRLRDMGLRMAPGTRPRNLLAQYIDTRELPERVTCTDRVGWHGGVYVLPSGSIGGEDGGRRFVFQSESGMEDTFRRHGTLQQWQQLVAAPCVGNSRLVFAVCVALAGPMLRLAEVESGGFHFRGESSQGKTTALKVATSVWGRPSYMQRWRTTDNALEATAVQHCDCTLILDEFGQLDPRVAGDVAYMLANDQEKGRATRGGMTRKRRTWRLLFLSSGEVSLAQHMELAAKTPRAGQEVRMLDVPLDAGQGMGGLEALHGFDRPGQLADAITSAAARVYGQAGREWLAWAARNFDTLPGRLRDLVRQYLDDFVPEAAAEQVRRAGTRFALVAAAGELATEAGITGWEPGQAAWATRQCFNAWLAARGHLDNGEHVSMLRQVQAYLEKNGDLQFTWMHRATDDHRAATPLRAGFKRLVDADGQALKIDAGTDWIDKRSTEESRTTQGALVEFMVLPQAFSREVCKGFDPNAVATVLRAAGHLRTDGQRLTNRVRLPGMGKVAVFHIKPSIFGGDDGQD